jgi:hypothetical protein
MAMAQVQSNGLGLSLFLSLPFPDGQVTTISLAIGERWWTIELITGMCLGIRQATMINCKWKGQYFAHCASWSIDDDLKAIDKMKSNGFTLLPGWKHNTFALHARRNSIEHGASLFSPYFSPSPGMLPLSRFLVSTFDPYLNPNVANVLVMITLLI